MHESDISWVCSQQNPSALATAARATVALATVALATAAPALRLMVKPAAKKGIVGKTVGPLLVRRLQAPKWKGAKKERD